MAWGVYRGEHDSNPDHPVWRRFGPRHERPCGRPEVVECAKSECQRANACTAIRTLSDSIPDTTA